MTPTVCEPATPDSRPRRATPPGPVVLGVTVIAVSVGVFLLADWWPGTRNLTDPDRLFFGGIAVLVLLVTALVWAIKTVYVIGRDRRWSWWIVAAPAAVLAGGGLAAVLPVPDFASARGELDAYVRQLPVDPNFTARDLRIGGLEISQVCRGRDGAVYLQDDDGTFLSVSSGWVYSPAQVPVGRDDFTSHPLGDGWYSYTRVWRD